MIARFYDPSFGSITLDDTPLNQLDPQYLYFDRNLTCRWLRSQIGYIDQNPGLFATSILENIRCGNQDASLEDVYTAARLAHAIEFIQHLPAGFNTLVGDRGTQLSGGQIQRIAIARELQLIFAKY